MAHGLRHRAFPEAQVVQQPSFHQQQYVQGLGTYEPNDVESNTIQNKEGYCYRFRASRRLFCNNKLISLFASMFRIRKLIFSKEGRRNKYFRSGYLRLASLQGIPEPMMFGGLAPPFCAILMGNEVVFDPVTPEEGRKIENINQKEVHLQEVPVEILESSIKSYLSQFGVINSVMMWPLQSDSPSRSVIAEFDSPQSAQLVESCRNHWIEGFKVVVAKKSSTKQIEYARGSSSPSNNNEADLNPMHDQHENDEDDSEDLELGTIKTYLLKSPEVDSLASPNGLPLYSPSSQCRRLRTDVPWKPGFDSKENPRVGQEHDDKLLGQSGGATQLFGLPTRRIVLPFPSNTKVVLEKLRSKDFHLNKLTLSSIAVPSKIVHIDEKNSSPSIFTDNYAFNICKRTKTKSNVLIQPSGNGESENTH
jgi:hypothetical protein